MPVASAAANVDAKDRAIYRMIKADLKDYWKDPVNKVLDDPIRAIIYSVGTKAIALFVAIIFTSIGYFVFGVSFALIDRVVIQNFTLFFHRVINCSKEFATSRFIALGNRFFEVVGDMLDDLGD